MNKYSKIKLLSSLIKSDGVFLIIPPMLLFVAGIPILFTIILSLISSLLFIIFLHAKKLLREKLRRLKRTPLQSFIEDSGLPEKDAKEAWRELDNIK